MAWACSRPVGDGDMEGRAAPESGLGPDLSTNLSRNPLADRQSDAGAGTSRGASPEELEHSLEVLRIDADAIVAHGDDPGFRFTASGHMNPWRAFTAVLDGIADQVLQKLHQTREVDLVSGKRIVGDLRSTLLDRH